MTPSNPCLSDDSLRDFALGCCAESDAVESHLSICRACLRRLDGLRELDERVETVLRRLRTLHESPGDSAQPETVALSASTAEPLTGTIGRYRIVTRLGAGGMGTVYRAEDPALGRLVAVKVPHREWLGVDPEQGRARFLREARAAARVRHPNVCAVYDTGEENGLPYVVLDLIEGPSLLERLRAGPLPPRQAAEWARQIAEALAAVHAAGLTHRDLKPGNVLLAPDGRALLTDFGLARPDEAEPLTREGLVVGTPAYMAPEQVAGEAVGPWSDLYALGLVLYQMLAGRLPFDGLGYHDRLPPPPSRWRPDVEPALDAIALKALAPRPEDRHRDARELADELARWLGNGTAPAKDRRPATVRVELPDGQPVTVRIEEGVPEGGKVQVRVRERPATRKRARAWAVSVTVTFCLLLGSILVLQWTGAPPQTGYVAVTGGGPPATSRNDPAEQERREAEERLAAMMRPNLTRVRSPRVRLTYDVETGAAEQKIELPFVMAVLADLAGEPKTPRRALKDRRFIEIDRDNFDDVLKRLTPRLLLPQPEGPPLELSFTKMEDFDPAKRDRKVLARSEYRRLESAWRGLYFLVRNTETSTSIKIRVFDVTAAELVADARVGRLEERVLYRKVYSEELSQIGGQPYGLILGAYEIGPGADDMTLLQSLAELGERASAPFIAAAAPEMLGTERFSAIPEPETREKDARLASWREFRGKETSRWAGLALPRVAARPPVEGESEPPWMSAVWVFGVEVASAQAKYGWPAQISLQTSSSMDDLPLWSPGSETARPTDVALTPVRAFDLAGRGFMPLLPINDKGRAAFADARSCRAVPMGSEEDNRLAVLLSIGQVARPLAVLAREKLASFLEPPQVEVWLNRWLSQYVDKDEKLEPAQRARRPYTVAEVRMRSREMIFTVRPLHQIDPPPPAPLRLIIPVP